MQPMRRVLLISAALLVGALFVLSATGCTWNFRTSVYPDKGEIEDAITDDAKWGVNPKTKQPLVARDATCVKETDDGQRWRCLIIFTNGKRIGAEVVAEVDGDFIVTPGWVDDARFVAPGDVNGDD